MKRLFSVLLILCLLPGILSGALTGSGAKQSAEAAGAAAKSGIVTIADPTQAQIIQAFQQYQQPTKRFSVAPSVKAPYATGAVDAEFINASAQYLNLYRLVAKLPTLTNSSTLNEIAQYGAVLAAANDVLAHEQAVPTDMSASFAERATLGTSVSNISAYNFRSDVAKHGWEWANSYKTTSMIPYALLFQIRDYDKSNYMVLGHRRFLLSPYIKEFGVGTADSADNYNFYYLISHSEKRWPDANKLVQHPDYDFVAWPPSGNCPTELMDKRYPWSISLNEERYLVPAIKDNRGFDTEIGDRSGIVVRVTRMSDGKVWTFDQNSPDGSSIADPRAYNAPYFCVDKHSRGYGPVRQQWISDTVQVGYFANNALIFRPDFEDGSPLSGIYNVRVTGLKKTNGSAAELNYNVNFFEIEECDHRWNGWTYITEPSCTTGGERSHMCVRCLTTETEPVPALNHDWSLWATAQAPTCTQEGVKEQTCGRCGEKKTGSIPALGHDWKAQTVTQAPDCTEAGIQESVCTRCGETETQTIPALGHDWNLNVLQEPNCTQDGAADAVCKRCGAAEQLTLPALGHDWGEGVVTREPTQEAPGQMVYTCRRCQETRTEELPFFQFEDVKDPSKYYYKPVYWAYRHDPRITGGTDATHFSPDAKCKREQIVTFLYAAFGKPEPKLTRSPFLDVEEGKYYAKAALWAFENKVAGGYTNELFGVGRPCIRAQAVTFLWAASGRPNPTLTESPFSDVKPTDYYYKPVLWALENGITSGISPTVFGWNTVCTRAQIVTFLYKTLNR